MHRLRTLLSTLGVCFGVMSVVAMLAIGEGSKQEILAHIQQLGTNNIIIKQAELSKEQQSRALEVRSYGLTPKDAILIQNNLPLVHNYSALKIVKSTLNGIHIAMPPEILAQVQ